MPIFGGQAKSGTSADRDFHYLCCVFTFVCLFAFNFFVVASILLAHSEHVEIYN